MNYIENQHLQDKWRESGFSEPTPIQVALYQQISKGNAAVAISPTGTGKTLAYLLPILEQVVANQTLQAIILAPSQELASQIAKVAQFWAEGLDLKVQLIVGGANVKRQQDELKAKPEIVVATPGRLNELATSSRKLKFHLVKFLVMDEADYLLGGDQAKALQAIEKRLMREVVKIAVSATLGLPLQERLKQNPSEQLVEIQAEQAPLKLEHHYILTTDRQKLKQLQRLAQVVQMKAIIFFEQVHQLEQIAAKLVYEGVKVAVLHGDLSKVERVRAIQYFQTSDCVYLLTTDVAARGIDFEQVPVVIHFNRVDTHETYMHRSGRTGRMGRAGRVISLVNEQELRDLLIILSEVAIELSQRYTYQGELVSELPVNEATQRPATNSKKMKTQKKGQYPSSSPSPHKESPKKKNRQRTVKNKGRRKPKSS